MIEATSIIDINHAIYGNSSFVEQCLTFSLMGGLID
jgi:hypothetical protein